MNLYQLTQYQLELLHKISLLDLDEQTIADTIEADGIGEAIADKLEAYAVVAKEIEALADARLDEAKRLTELATAGNKKATAMREYIKHTMETLKLDAVSSAKFEFKLKKNPAKVEIFGIVPAQFFVQKPQPEPEISKTLIKDALKVGCDLSAFAKLVQDSRLEIK